MAESFSDGRPPPRTPQRGLHNWDFTKPIAGGPTDRGFDYYFGVDLPNLEQSRSTPTVPELYRLDSDVGEQIDVSRERPDVVEPMTKDLRTLIDRGTSRDGQIATNDTIVRFETTQEKRWAP